MLCEAARSVGYALAVHGTMTRDFDLIAVPWTDDAVGAEGLAQAIRDVSGGSFIEVEGCRREGRDPTPKPHGRVAYTIVLDGVRIDLSVTPRLVGFSR